MKSVVRAALTIAFLAVIGTIALWFDIVTVGQCSGCYLP